MDWSTVAALIISVGLPAAEKLIANWQNKEPVTLEKLAELRGLMQQTAADRLKAQASALGIPLDDPNVQSLLKLM